MYRINSHEEESLFGEIAESEPLVLPRVTKSDVGRGSGQRRNDGKTNSLTSFKDSSIAAEQHAKFQARFQKGKGSDASTDQPQQMQQQNNNFNNEAGDDDNEEEPGQDASPVVDSKAASIAAQLKTEQIRRQLLLSDAFYLARPSKSRGRRSHTTMAAIHAKYKDRNISKKQQQKLYAKRFGNQRKEGQMEAAVKRKELAEKLQRNLDRVSEENNRKERDETGYAESDVADSVAWSPSKSERGYGSLSNKLLGWIEEEREMSCQGSTHLFDYTDITKSDSSESSGILGWNAGTVGSDDKFDQLGSVLNVPLREQSASTLPPLRMVVISDTHGFEGGLSKFSTDNQHNDDFLLPQADILLHCGDFAASGSRKTQRQAARRLDEFLARQTHIPEKIVVKGNHDPESPAKVLFPDSKALYVRASSTLVVNGVTFALEPYSRRMSLRSLRRRASASSMYAPSPLPSCDVLVSHEPPKGVLDSTYHGISAGSSFLREQVEHAEEKPRLWLCGHIHEGRGTLTRTFKPDVCGKEAAEGEAAAAAAADSTMVINCSNANSGRANRLVSGAVVVDVERNPGEETARSTLQLRAEDDDDLMDGANGALPGMDNLELRITRPGVRRRKGVPQSVRQQRLQQSRSNQQ